MSILCALLSAVCNINGVSGRILNMVLFPSAMAMHGSIKYFLKPGIPGMGPGKLSPVQEFRSMPASTCKLYSYSSDACKSELS